MSTRLSEENHGYNHLQARENIEKYASEKHIADPALHLLKKNGKPNTSAIAKHFGFDFPGGARTIRKFFSDDPQTFNASTFGEIAKNTGIHEAYWRGLTTETDQAVYEEELRERLLAEERMTELERLQEEGHRKRVEKRESFFDELGFRYRCSPDWECVDCPHELTKRTGPEEVRRLTDPELKAAIKKLSEVLDFLTYQKR